MIIPKFNKVLRDEKVLWIRDACLLSSEDRKAMYMRRKRYYMYGTYGQDRVLYNRLMAHLDLVASFLYAADGVRFAFSATRNAEKDVVKQALSLEHEWNDKFRDSGIAYQYAIGLLWALIYDHMFLKLGWNDARDEIFAKLVSPADFAVFDESETDLDSQEAFVHTYRIHWDNAVLRLARAGMKDRIKELGVTNGPQNEDMPLLMAQMILSNSAGSNLIGQVQQNYEPQASYEAKSQVPMVEMQEVWVWDDATEDYAIFTIAAPGIILSDSRETIEAIAKADNPKFAEAYESESNIFMPDEHPFAPICPYPLPDYFWGKGHTEDLIPLQKWTNERLDQIHEILERQVDPAKVFSGFMGLSDEKAGALGGPGTWVMDQLPGAKVEELKPEMPPDLFAELKEIGGIFLEASGLTETTTGKGDQNVKGGKHAKQLATTGSGRIKKVAVGLEPSLVRVGDLGMKLTMRNQEEHIITDDGQRFVASQFPEMKWNMRVAGHSHSPLFKDEGKDDAIVLLKSQAIDREMFIRLMHPPNEDNIVHSLRERLQKEAQAAAQNPEQPPGKAKPKG